MTALLTYRRTGNQEFHGNVEEISLKYIPFKTGSKARFILFFENGSAKVIKEEDEIDVQVTESGAN